MSTFDELEYYNKQYYEPPYKVDTHNLVSWYIQQPIDHKTHFHASVNQRWLITGLYIESAPHLSGKTFKVAFRDLEDFGHGEQWIQYTLSEYLLMDLPSELDAIKLVASAMSSYVKDPAFAEAVVKYYKDPKPKFAQISESQPKEVDLLPGLNVSVQYPCDCNYNYPLRNAIIHLNDIHGWSREKIADWLDEISDPTGETGPDLRFKPKTDTVELPDEPMEGYTSVGSIKDEAFKFDYPDWETSSLEEMPQSTKALQQMTASVELTGLNNEMIKLLMGEDTNEHDSEEGK